MLLLPPVLLGLLAVFGIASDAHADQRAKLLAGSPLQPVPPSRLTLRFHTTRYGILRFSGARNGNHGLYDGDVVLTGREGRQRVPATARLLRQSGVVVRFSLPAGSLGVRAMTIAGPRRDGSFAVSSRLLRAVASGLAPNLPQAPLRVQHSASAPIGGVWRRVRINPVVAGEAPVSPVAIAEAVLSARHIIGPQLGIALELGQVRRLTRPLPPERHVGVILSSLGQDLSATDGDAVTILFLPANYVPQGAAVSQTFERGICTRGGVRSAVIVLVNPIVDGYNIALQVGHQHGAAGRLESDGTLFDQTAREAAAGHIGAVGECRSEQVAMLSLLARTRFPHGGVDGADPTAFLRDVTGDGRADYVTAATSATKRRILALHRGLAVASFGSPEVRESVEASRGDSEGQDLGLLVDLSGDGRREYVVVEEQSSRRHFLRYNLNGLRRSDGQRYTTNRSFTRDLSGRDRGFAADINGDGRQEYVVVWPRQGLRSFITFFLSAGESPVPWVSSLTSHPYQGDEALRDRGEFTDFNSDGRFDYITTPSRGKDGSLSALLYLGDAAGRLRFERNIAFVAGGNRSFVEPSDSGLGAGSYLVRSPNGARRFGIVDAVNGRRRLSLYRWHDQTGSFVAESQLVSDYRYQELDTGSDDGEWVDVTGDGVSDYVATDLVNGHRELRVYRLAGDGSVAEARPFLVPDLGPAFDQGEFEGFADVDGDRLNEYVVVARDGSDRLFAIFRMPAFATP